MEFFEKGQVCAKCDHCRVACTTEDLYKTVPMGHGTTFQIWHKACGVRVSGINENLPHSSYALIEYSDEGDKIRELHKRAMVMCEAMGAEFIDRGPNGGGIEYRETRTNFARIDGQVFKIEISKVILHD